ncbi:hypothetical protein [Streptomyces sp. NPDC001568]|uniref:hypothetical protein n=1 Tax=Streptomyces sp. NPDC001568 TaxID=3364588 RepID=UPI0036C6E278
MNTYDLADAFRLDPRADAPAPRTADPSGAGARDLSVPDWMTTGCADPGSGPTWSDGR